MRTEERSVSSFTKVEVHGAIDVYLSQGKLTPVRIETDENLISYIEVIEEGNSLTLTSRKGYNLDPSRGIKVYISSPSIKSIDVSGASNITGQTKMDISDKMVLMVSGSGEMNMEVDAPKIEASISGSGEVNLKGKTRDFELSLSGAGNASCYELLSENTSVDISGAGGAEVYASQELKADVSGAGKVSYKGNAKNINQQVSGAGTVKKVD